MDDNKSEPQNQAAPIDPSPQAPTPSSQPPVYETIEIGGKEEPQPLQPEEIAPNVASPDEAIQPQTPTEVPPGDMPPVYEENKGKYFIIAGGVIFFLVI